MKDKEEEINENDQIQDDETTNEIIHVDKDHF